MIKFPRYLLNIVIGLMLPTRCFGLKRSLCTLSGILLGIDSKVTADCKFYGNGLVSIGDRTWVGIGAQFHVPSPAQITIGNNCDIAPGVVFLCGSHLTGNTSRRAGDGFVESIVVGSGVWIGAGTMLLPGVYLEDGIAVAAGSVVKKGRYAANSLLAGNPATVKKIYEH